MTLSEEQLGVANARAGELNLADRAQFRLQDYRETPGPFDRIISVGMFEHVGVDYYDTYFKRCAELLTDDGVMMLHSIGRPEGPGITNPWIAKYIFPGGYIPALSEVLPAIERAGLLVADIEILRLHYAETLKAWRERFLARREEAAKLYDERFVRMWEFYLASSEMSFRKQKRHGVPDPAHQAAGRRSTHPRLHPPARNSGCAASKRRKARCCGWRENSRRAINGMPRSSANRTSGHFFFRPVYLVRIVHKATACFRRVRSECLIRAPHSPNWKHTPSLMAITDSNIIKLAPEAGTPAYRTAPHNIEAEQGLLGAILVNNDAFYRVSDFLEPKHFFEPIHQLIFETTSSIIRAGKVATR